MEEVSEFIIDEEDFVVIDVVRDKPDAGLMETTGNMQEREKKTLEIERKFIIPNNCEERIRDLGGNLIKEEEFTDHYYDTSNYKLTLRDRWLRSRSGKWQMKYPLVENPGDRTVSKYYETEEEQEIIGILKEFCTGTYDTVQDYVRNECQPIAVIRTSRKSYRIEGATVCLDLTDFGFRTGEVEVIVRGEENFSDALQFVNQLAFKLGFTSLALYDISLMTPDRCV